MKSQYPTARCASENMGLGYNALGILGVDIAYVNVAMRAWRRAGVGSAPSTGLPGTSRTSTTSY